MNEIASYRAAYSDNRLLGLLFLMFALADVALFTGMIVFEAEIAATGRKGLIIGGIITFVVLSPLWPMLLTRTAHTWRLFPDQMAFEERPALPLLLRRRIVAVPFERLCQVRSTEGLMGIRHIELEDDAGRRFRLAPKVEGGPNNWRVDTEGFNAFIAEVRTHVEARRGPLAAGPLPVLWETGLGVGLIALFLLVPVGTMLVASWLTVTRGSFAAFAMAFGSLLLSGTVYAMLRKAWLAYQAKKAR